MLLIVSRGCPRCGSKRMERYVERERVMRVCANCGQRVSLEESMEIVEASNACPDCGEKKLHVTKTTRETIRGKEYVIRRMACANVLCGRVFKISTPAGAVVAEREEQDVNAKTQRRKGAGIGRKLATRGTGGTGRV